MTSDSANLLTTIAVSLTGTGMAVARDVSLLGPVLGIDADRTRPGRYSRHVQMLPSLSSRALDAQLAADLVAYAQRHPHPVVLVPAADDACEWAIAHRAQLHPHIRVSAGYTSERAGMLLDKSTFAQRCRELGIDVPATLQPESMADVRTFARDVGLPCIVKPRAGHKWRDRLSGQKLLVPNTLAELEKAMTEIVGDPAAVVLQELVAGPESNLAVGAVWADQQGEVRHVLTARKIRQFPRQFGSGSRVVTEDLPEVARLSADVVKALDYRGLCGTEFKQDARTGRWRLIEINPRPTLWYDLCRAAGTHLIRAHVEELAGLSIADVAPQKNGVAWTYGLRDVVALGQAGGVPAVLQALRQESWANTDAVMALDDPRATLASMGHFAAQALAHLRPGRTKK
jgi:D-aspartate ligase